MTLHQQNSEDVPALGSLTAQQVRETLAAAAAAPTLGQPRPWTLRCRAECIELSLLPINPVVTPGMANPVGANFVVGGMPTDLIICGMVLLNLRLAGESWGAQVTTVLMPDTDRPALLAHIRIDGPRPVATDQLALVAEIPYVQTNTRGAEVARSSFGPLAVPAAVTAKIRHAARTEQAWAAPISNQQIIKLRLLVDVAQHYLLDAPAPLLIVVGTITDDSSSRLRAGLALQRMLLVASESGLAATSIPLTAGVDSARGRLRELIGGGLWPQVLVRIGAFATVSQGNLALAPVAMAQTQTLTGN